MKQTIVSISGLDGESYEQACFNLACELRDLLKRVFSKNELTSIQVSTELSNFLVRYLTYQIVMSFPQGEETLTFEFAKNELVDFPSIKEQRREILRKLRSWVLTRAGNFETLSKRLLEQAEALSSEDAVSIA